MEFLKTCNTNAHAIGDFEAIEYQAFSVRRNTTPTSKVDDRTPSEDTRAVEAELRQSQHLILQDSLRPWLWLFRGTTVDQVGQKPRELPTLEGYDTTREQSGVMKASELMAQPPMRPLNRAAASTNSPATLGPMKIPQSGGPRPQEQSQSHDIWAIYELFTSSVVAALSYHLVKDYGVIGLNYRTFLSKQEPGDDIDQESARITDSRLQLSDIHVYWASSGTLVVSIMSTANPDIRSLEDTTSSEQKNLVGRCVRVAPSGSLAIITTFDDPLDAAIEDTGLRLQRKRMKVSSAERCVDKWKSSVIRWLVYRGYALPDLEKKASWVRIRVARTNQVIPPSPSFSSRSKEILWPRALCFLYGDSEATPAALLQPSTAPLDWFETPQSAGFRDPIDSAQNWYLGKAERDRIVEARRRAQKAEEESVRTKDEMPGGLFPSSPLNSRTGAYGELQAVSGVYPTPPDGIVPGTAISSGDTPSISGLPMNTVLVPGGNNPAINLSAPQDNGQSDEQMLPAPSPDFSMPYDQFNASSGNDDLFDDMDEDTFEGNGVTDADFNFFDEPDGDDVDMLDAPISQATKSPLKKSIKDKKGQSMPDVMVKEESSDPMAALEDALANASVPGDNNAILKDDTSVVRESPLEVIPKIEEQPQLSYNDTQSAVPARKEPTPPLSPRHIHKRLLPSPKNKAVVISNDQDGQRDSAFGPVIFSQKTKLSDVKYLDGRFGLVHGKPVAKQIQVKPAKRPASLREMPLLTKLRYAIGVASKMGIPEIECLSRTDDDFTDASSDTSSLPEEAMDDLQSIPPEPQSAGLLPGKRKLPTDGNATPMSAISLAESFGGESTDFGGLQTDESCLASLEPSPWDWPLTGAPGPIEAQFSSRFSIPLFSPVVASMPNTPTSQPDMSLDFPDEKPLSRNDSIGVAQVVTEQIASATLDIIHERSARDLVVRTSSSYLQGAIKHLFPQAAECTVSSLISVHDVFPENFPQPKGAQRPPPRRPNEPPPTPGHHVYQINAPYMRIRRADTLWDLLPPALSFWETLGLSPCSPAKNVAALCIYPYSESLRPCLDNFMLNMTVAYESCKLGTHTKGETIPDYEGGLVPCKIGASSSLRNAFKALRDTCFNVGKLLAMKHAKMRENDDSKVDAFVIYMVDPCEDTTAVWELCSAFWSLFQAYGQGPPARPEHVPKPDLVLQIVPMKYIASFDTPVILSTSTYIGLAREVYDRCPPSAPSEDKTPLSIYSAPSFQLEESLPRAIPFSLNAETPQDLLRENSYIHIGYAISLDGAWVTAAWTDRCGKSQTIVSYNLGTKAFGEVAKEIWTTTIEILQARRVTWRVCIARAGVMERDELETWKYLASCPTHFNLFTTLLTVDANPSLQFSPTLPPANPQATNNTNPTMNTPGSTPQAGVSPDPHGLTPAATPSAEAANDPSADPDARLVDLTDEAWGVVLAHRLHNSNATVEFRPSLISGLLVKRGSASQAATATTSSSSCPPNTLASPPLQGPIVVGVNILWVGAVNPTNPNRAAIPQSPFSVATDGTSPGPSPVQERPSSSLMWTPTTQMRTTAENLLKEMLGQYRGLGTLAKLKGINGTKGGTVPWHVAVAKRGVDGLTKCLNGMN